MVRRPAAPVVGTPTLSPAQAHARLSKQLEAGEALARSGLAEGAYSTWWEETKHWLELEQSFGENSSKVQEFEAAGSLGMVTSSTDFAAVRRDSLAAKLSVLRAYVNVLQTTAESAQGQPSPARTAPASSDKVFVVHGHDDGAKETVARYLEKLRLPT